jgi:hypothetical protein
MTTRQYNALLKDGSDDFRKLNAKAAEKRYGKPKDRLPKGMNKLERAYADRLALQKACGMISDYRWTGDNRKTYRMNSGVGHTYTPDFLVWRAGEAVSECHEVKGYTGGKFRLSVRNFDDAAEHNPIHVFRMFTRQRGEWVEIRTRNGAALATSPTLARVGACTPASDTPEATALQPAALAGER